MQKNYATGKINFAEQKTESFAPREITWSLAGFS